MVLTSHIQRHDIQKERAPNTRGKAATFLNSASTSGISLTSYQKNFLLCHAVKKADDIYHQSVQMSLGDVKDLTESRFDVKFPKYHKITASTVSADVPLYS